VLLLGCCQSLIFRDRRERGTTYVSPLDYSNTTMGAVCAKSSTRKIKALFRRSTRYRDHKGRLPGLLAEVELLPGLTTENIWASGVTWEEFHRFLRYKIVWMTPDVCICFGYMSGIGESVFSLGGDGHIKLCVHVTRGTTATGATATCDFLVRLLATCQEHGVSINGRFGEVSTTLSSAGLSLFFQGSHSCLRQVTLYKMILNADQCHALANISRLDMELAIHNCKLADDAAGAFVECLHSDRGPAELNACDIDNQILVSALTGNSRVARFTPYWETTDADTAVLFAALANNSGLAELDCQHHPISDDNWSILCESMKAHPTLTNLNLLHTSPSFDVPAEQKAHRTRLLAEMVQHNTFMLTIGLSAHERDAQIYTDEILPCLETNRYRSWVHAIRKADIPIRRPLLGLALQTESVQNDSSLRWMFLSGNPDVVVRPN
jgi:hypothetical protein